MTVEHHKVSRRDFLYSGAAAVAILAVDPLAYARSRAPVITIFDDLGAGSNDVKHIRKLAATKKQWVAAILPGSKYCLEVCREVNDYRQIGTLLHLPGEPDNKEKIKYMERHTRTKDTEYDPGRHFGVYSFDPEERVARIVIKDVLYLEDLIGEQISGINIHTGSKALKTQAVLRGIRSAMFELNMARPNNLIFINSRTYKERSHDAEVRRVFQGEFRVPYFEQDIWLDSYPRSVKKHEQKLKHTVGQLERARVRASYGEPVIAIGHIGYRPTVEAYEKMAEKGYPFGGLESLKMGQNAQGLDTVTDRIWAFIDNRHRALEAKG